MRVAQVPRFTISIIYWLFGRTSDTHQIKEDYLKMLCCDHQFSEIRRIACEFAETVLLGKVHRKAMDRIRWHNQNQHRVVLASASLDIYLEPLAGMLDVGDTICTRLVRDEGLLTGNIDGRNCKGREKLNRLLTELPAQDIAWEQSFGYSDSISDLPMLEHVGHAVAVNPGKRLRDVAKDRKWAIEYWD